MILRTLVVEDEANEAQHLTDLLHRYGKAHGHEFAITWHSSAMEMLSDRGRYDLCLLDIEMPGIDGMEAASLLRTYDDQIPIIFVTNLAKYAGKDKLEGDAHAFDIADFDTIKFDFYG